MSRILRMAERGRGTGIVLERMDRPSHDGGALRALTSPLTRPPSTGGRKPLGSLAGLPWNGWPDCRGIRSPAGGSARSSAFHVTLSLGAGTTQGARATQGAGTTRREIGLLLITSVVRARPQGARIGLYSEKPPRVRPLTSWAALPPPGMPTSGHGGAGSLAGGALAPSLRNRRRNCLVASSCGSSSTCSGGPSSTTTPPSR